MLSVLPATSHGRAQAPLAASASTACASSVAASAPGPRERLAQHAVAEHLRRLRLPESGPILGAQDARRRFAVLALQRVGDRNRQQSADRVVGEFRHEPPQRFLRHAGPRGIVHQHPVVIVATRSEREQRIGDRFRARSAAAAQRLDAFALSDDALVEHVVRRQRDDGRGEPERCGEPRHRAHEQRLPAEIGVLLRQRAAEAAAAACRRNQRHEARLRRFALPWTRRRYRHGHHSRSAMRSSSSGLNPMPLVETPRPGVRRDDRRSRCG